MVSTPPEPSSRPASPAERLHAARFVLAAAAAALLAGTVIWDVPLAFSAAAVVVLAVVASFVPRRRARLGGAGELRSPTIWPDSGLKAALEAFPRAGFILDREGVVRYANQRAAALFPATRPNDPFTLTFRLPDIGDALKQAQEGRASTTEYHEAGETNAYSVSLAPIRMPGQAPSFVLVTFEDVSDRLAIARMRSDFVANASHELRTPLASLTGFIETLQGSARNDPHATEKFLAIMLDQARRMRRLLDDLLSLSRVEMRVHRRPTDTVDLVGVLRHLADALAPLAQEHGVALAISVPDAPVPVLGDRDELVQVFGNLAENAIRYGASGGRAEVLLDPPESGDGSLAVHVQDYGPGIAAEHLPRLTERFYRVDVGASRQMKGTGLGLAIVKHILTRHQGRLEIRSELGKGARFTVILPRSPGDGGPAHERQGAAAV
jgi:two-component system, OmpR family, phosphate regulon sensor histidine kinase PhoR